MIRSAVYGKVIEEIKAIPEEHLPAVYTVLRRFRSSARVKKNGKFDVMKYAGCWKNMPDRDYASFVREIKAGRSGAFRGRRS